MIGSRRYHYNRLKKQRQFYYGRGDREFTYVMTPRQLGMVATTPQLCSCRCCGNPRKHEKEITRQEKVNLLNYKEQCEEYMEEIGTRMKATDEELTVYEHSSKLHPSTPVTCNLCDHKCQLWECPIEMESEGWEYQEYEVLICPSCGEGDISI